MSYKYQIIYSAKTTEDDHMHGEVDIETEKALETPEELVAVSRRIGNENGYVEVALDKITEFG